MKFQNIFQDTKEAFERGEVYELLTGKKGYDLKVLDIPVNVPTDWSRVIPLGIHRLYEENRDERVREKFIEAIRKLLGGCAEEVWIAANVLFSQMNAEGKGRAPFSIEKALLSEFRNAVIRNRSVLESTAQEGEGLTMLQDIFRLDMILREDYGTSLFPSEGR